MSRVAKQPIEVPKGVEVTISGQDVSAKGPKGQESVTLHKDVAVTLEDGVLGVSTSSKDQKSVAMTGTMRSLLNNLVTGVNTGFQKKLELRGVGYRAQAQGSNLNLTLGFSHPVVHKVPNGITIETPSQTEIIVSGINKQVVGQVAADIRGYRPPEPYKGKGVRYVDEYVAMKEAKKK
ncbi:50S ribosomal protein L6 [Granulosicoccus antarcticus]|uniref:Large ribosomal subunit protein uL6 n=1 Tax=Granulosicoccus antarcticus IMCC3135 TaxID=1192854 RepID=A0A2Z2NKL7_9GAMM|nr:50S ribosomal protein L6 [Granulosicoccus antarcticus]ASJ71856.1 50S ribosomal protein L6 [Granulosicoccus antarcticus IMCC3135]